jgi:hypothetical protein
MVTVREKSEIPILSEKREPQRHKEHKEKQKNLCALCVFVSLWLKNLNLWCQCLRYNEMFLRHSGSIQILSTLLQGDKRPSENLWNTCYVKISQLPKMFSPVRMRNEKKPRMWRHNVATSVAFFHFSSAQVKTFLTISGRSPRPKSFILVGDECCSWLYSRKPA